MTSYRNIENLSKLYHFFLKLVSDSFQGFFLLLWIKHYFFNQLLEGINLFLKKSNIHRFHAVIGMKMNKYFKIPNFKSKSQSLDLRRNKQNFSDQNRYLCPRDTKEDKKFQKFLADYLFTAIISWRNKNWLFNKCSR